MFGQNQVTSKFQEVDGSLLVNSLFYTLQGEGPDAGHPAIFLRLSKCNLRCYFCDTEFEKGETFTLTEIFGQILELSKRHDCNLLVITGGEPLLQNVLPLTRICNEYGLVVSIETAGTVWLDGLQLLFDSKRTINDNLIVCSPKTPVVNPRVAKLVGAYKYIIGHASVDNDDGLPLVSTQQPGVSQKLYRPCDLVSIPIYLQPMDVGDDEVNIVNRKLAASLCLEYGYRLSVQSHKIVGVQ